MPVVLTFLFKNAFCIQFILYGEKDDISSVWHNFPKRKSINQTGEQRYPDVMTPNAQRGTVSRYSSLQGEHLTLSLTKGQWPFPDRSRKMNASSPYVHSFEHMQVQSFVSLCAESWYVPLKWNIIRFYFGIRSGMKSIYSGSNTYLIPCWFCRFAHLQRMELCIILIRGTF